LKKLEELVNKNQELFRKDTGEKYF